ncbi:hypothetical protein CIG75_07185 [Tumebacillus algifaecis]|uniref:N-acetyltransferase domain-containing protein n=1 Tax=Tumebacillus algifaecis TaxID=1214604 RepID=A0A223CZL1_9BACL|nr:GNAT family N-acetyltransferase [Tumebacillus algifaecis]ASS74781.1 hypothetical protein CIG75_07185 [Tumebacillus algifaecis]
MQYRLITALDQLTQTALTELSTLIKEAWRKVYINLGVYSDAYERDESFWGCSMIEKELKAGHRWLIAYENDRCIAAVLLEQTEPALMLRLLGVHPDHQGRSLGAALIGQAEQIARSEGSPSLTLFTSSLLTTLVAFYERLGFQMFKRESVTRFGLNYDRVFLQKLLN